MRIDCVEPEYLLSEPGTTDRVLLRSWQGGPIEETLDLVLRGSGYPTTEDAAAACNRWLSAFINALSINQLGADFGVRGTYWPLTPEFVNRYATEEHPVVYPDLPTSLIFETEPSPYFIGLRTPEITVGKAIDRIAEATVAAFHTSPPLTERQGLAFATYSRSFDMAPDVRLVTLISAVELLLHLEARPPAARALVESMIQTVKDSGLPDDQKSSLRGSLSWMLNESISQAARKLAATLGERTYMGESAPKFITRCYELRSALVHGKTMPPRGKVDIRGAELERMVGDLIGIAIRDQFDYGPQPTFVGAVIADEWDGDPNHIPFTPVAATFDATGD